MESSYSHNVPRPAGGSSNAVMCSCKHERVCATSTRRGVALFRQARTTRPTSGQTISSPTFHPVVCGCREAGSEAERVGLGKQRPFLSGKNWNGVGEVT